MDPDRIPFSAEIVRENAKNRLFMEAGKSILIQGNCVLCGFQNSKEISINGKCKKSNFDQISKRVRVDGDVSGCVFNGVGEVRIAGTAKKCTFIGVDRRNIFISDGTGKGCTLDGMPLMITSRAVQKVFSFGAGSVVFGSSTGGGSRTDAVREVKRVQPSSSLDAQSGFTLTAPFAGRNAVKFGADGKMSVEKGGVIEGGGNSVVIGSVKSGGISWGAINIKGGMMMRGYTVEVTGSGSIGGIPVTPGRYAKRLGDNETLYRQDLSASPTLSPWEVYQDGEWIPAELTPTLSR